MGSVVNLEMAMADTLAPAVFQATQYVQAADSAHADETGAVEGREEGGQARLAVDGGNRSGGPLSYRHQSRQKMARTLLGRTSLASSSATGGVVTHRFHPVPPLRRGVCVTPSSTERLPSIRKALRVAASWIESSWLSPFSSSDGAACCPSCPTRCTLTDEDFRCPRCGLLWTRFSSRQRRLRQ